MHHDSLVGEDCLGTGTLWIQVLESINILWSKMKEFQ